MADHPHNTISARETGNGVYQNDITIGAHSLRADEPRSLGGDDSGPTPMELAGAALAACTSITLRMYANRKKWPLRTISVDVTHKKGPREVCDEEHHDGAALIDIFTKSIHLTGPLDDAQKERLLQISKKCPVHKALAGNSCMRTDLKVDAE